MGRRFKIAAALVVLLTCTFGAATPAFAAKKKRACAKVAAVPQAETLPRAYNAVLCLINRERARRKLRPLRRSAQLNRAARKHSADMVSRQYFSHQSLDGRTAHQRVLRTGYFRGSSRGSVREALACGWAQLSTPQALVALIMRSRAHRSIMLSRSLRDIGIGLVIGGPQRGPGGGATLTLKVARR